MTLLLLIGCGLSDTKTADTGGEDTAEPTGDAYACVETARTAVTDPTVVSEGMTFAPADVTDAYAGGFAGRFTFVSGDEQLAGFAVNPEGNWEFVTREATGTPDGEADPTECGSLYAFRTTAVLNDASGAFDEIFPAGVVAPSLDAVTLVAMIPIDVMVGTSRPTGWDPSAWPQNTLAVNGFASTDRWDILVQWQASTGGPPPESPEDTGTVEPSGMTEGVGSGVFTPAEE